MSIDSDPGIARAWRAHPVADAPVDALLARADELARRWAIAMIVARPLSRMAEVPLEDLSRAAPGLCSQFVLALDSDAELARLVARGEVGGLEGSAHRSRLAALSRAGDASACAEQVELLRGVLWEATLAELRDPPARLVADLCDRLAFVCAAALAAALEQAPVAERPDMPSAPPAGAREQVLYRTPQTQARGRRAVLVDERVERAPSPSPNPQPPPSPNPQPPPTSGRPLPWDTPPTDRGASPSPAGGDPLMRVTRRPVSPVDERP